MCLCLFSQTNKVREVEELGVRVRIHVYKSNNDLVEGLQIRRVIRDEAIRETMLAIDRGIFINEDQKQWQYEDRALPLGYNSTISAPHIHSLGLRVMYLGLKDRLNVKIL
ncbi:MAG: hypothetical protein EZS28_045871, partial [Streblomastix strix]